MADFVGNRPNTPVFEPEGRCFRSRRGDAAGGTCGPTFSLPTGRRDNKVELLDWQDIVRAEIARPAVVHVAKGSDHIRRLCVFRHRAKRYFELFWPYALFFLTPYFHVFANIAISATLGIIAAELCGYNPALARLRRFVATFCVSFAIPVQTAARFAFTVRRALADWNFAREYMYGRCPETDARLDDFAAEARRRAARANECATKS